MMPTHAADAQMSALPDEPFVAGICHDHEVHAVPRELAQHTIDQQMDSPVAAAAVCGRFTTVMLAMPSLSEWRPTRLCAYCGWAIAIETHTIEARLDAITPAGQTRAALARLIGDPLMARRLCEAVIARASGPDADYELGHGATTQILATITRHAPTLGLPEDCAEGDCDHWPADPAGQDPTTTVDASGECDYPVASAVCPACTLRAGGWAGEWEGSFMDECYIHAPCGVLAVLAAHYNVKIRPSTVALCGSTRFADAMTEAAIAASLDGQIVLAPHVDLRHDRPEWADPDVAARIKTELDALHLAKIDRADEVLVVNVGGYIGESTRAEIDYAHTRGTPVRYVEPVVPS